MKSRQKYFAILEKLGVYRFLTLQQMVALGIGKYTTNISVETADLIRDGLIEKIQEKKGAMAVYYLSKKGAKRVETLFSFIPRYPKNKLDNSRMLMDIEHRLAIIDFHIAINQFEPTLCFREFDYRGSQKTGNLEKMSAIPLGNSTIIPDLIFKLPLPKGDRLYLVEVELSKGKTIKDYFEKKLDKYIELTLNKKVLQAKFGIKTFHTVLFNIDDPKFLKEAMQVIKKDKRMKEHPINRIGETFLFKTFEGDVYSSWVNLEMKERLLFY